MKQGIITLIVPENKGIFKTAAKEFSSLFLKITGKKCRITRRYQPRGDIVLFGSDVSNTYVHDLVKDGVISGLKLCYGADSYHILSVDEGQRRILILGSGNDRSLMYAVYRFFEYRADCRYFWDGDILPQAPSIDIAGIDLAEAPRFEYRGLRYFAHRGLKRFQAEHWGLDDWKREIDWILKKRLNVFMLRIGMDDLFQKAFPENVPYPDPDQSSATDIPRSYDDRTLFWPLQFRGKLREKILIYARERGLMHPEDCGTMTHWYSRTPQSFLDQVKPEFIPQYTQSYLEPSGRVWDFQIKRNMDNYFKLTSAHIKHYGKPELFHTIGLAERGCYSDPVKDFQLKLYAYHKIEQNVHSKYPNSPLLVASWDMFCTWSCDEVKEFLSSLNPQNTIFWDYTSDCFDELNNFTNWGVIRKFPYVFGIFHAFMADSEIRGNYDAIERRFPLAAEDPMCKGMIFWPENSHADTLMLEFFASSAWNPSNYKIASFIADFCQARYCANNQDMEKIWRMLLPLIKLGFYRWTRFRSTSVYPSYPFSLGHQSFHLCDLDAEVLDRNRVRAEELRPYISCAVEALEQLSELSKNPSDPFMFRDTVDLARTAALHLLNFALSDLTVMLEEWRNNKQDSVMIIKRLAFIERFMKITAEIIGAHKDFSLNDSLDELKKVYRVNPNFEKTLKGNSENFYCRSFVYELFKACYIPELKAYFRMIRNKLKSEDRSAWITVNTLKTELRQIQDYFYETPLQEFAPDIESCKEKFRSNLKGMAEAAQQNIPETALKIHSR